MMPINLKLKRKAVDPVVFSVVLITHEGQIWNSIVVCHSLDQAIREATKRAIEQTEHDHPSCFVEQRVSFLPMTEVLARAGEVTYDFKVRKEPKPRLSRKNTLIKRIIDNEDAILYEKNKGQFTEAECKMIEHRLKT